MSENVEIVRRANALFNAGDFDAAFETVHPDVVFRDLQNAPDLPEALRGRESLLHALGHWLDAYDELGVEVEDYIEMGSWVIADVPLARKGAGQRSQRRRASGRRVQGARRHDRRVGHRLPGHGNRH